MVRDPAGRLVLVWAVAQILVGTLVFRRIEGWSTINALYCSVATLATVGYGDCARGHDALRSAEVRASLPR